VNRRAQFSWATLTLGRLRTALMTGTRRSISPWMKAHRPDGVFVPSSGISSPSGARRWRSDAYASEIQQIAA
jgi:hypothetical protein